MKVLTNILALLLAYFLAGGVAVLFAQTPQANETIKLNQYPLKQDKELGASVARIGEGRLHQIDATLVEIPAGGQLAPHRHLTEEIIYFISGKGHTLMWNQQGGKQERYEWSGGDLMSPSLNAWHQHVNTSDTPARYVSFTTAPVALNLYHDPAFLSSSDFIFADRWKQGITQKPEYRPEGADGHADGRMTVGHFLPNIVGRELHSMRKGAWGITIRPDGDLAGNRLLEMEVREKQGDDPEAHMHRHPWEVAYIVLEGMGYSNLQREGEPKRVLNWQKGDMYIVEANEFHVNRPREDAKTRYLQVKVAGYFHGIGNVGQTIELIDE